LHWRWRLHLLILFRCRAQTLTPRAAAAVAAVASAVVMAAVAAAPAVGAVAAAEAATVTAVAAVVAEAARKVIGSETDVAATLRPRPLCPQYRTYSAKKQTSVNPPGLHPLVDVRRYFADGISRSNCPIYDYFWDSSDGAHPAETLIVCNTVYTRQDRLDIDVDFGSPKLVPHDHLGHKLPSSVEICRGVRS
jgi:uncharacterized membrane protein